MPILVHVLRSDRPGVAQSDSDSWTDQIWPAVIAVTTLAVFAVFLIQTGPMLALLMALATLVAATVLVTLVTGTVWLTRLRRLVRRLLGHR
ncbi:hypothetical protein [Actinomadura sp. 21ATH]|uniref:hypothetical protein n=1 Tax=Actinomadura sp. 21ATH TaxID=1735444 RepID=UPI0035BF23BC